MKKYYAANGVLVGVMTLFMISALLFLAKDKFLLQEESGINDYKVYLTDKLNLMDKLQEDPEGLCEIERQDNIYQQIGKIIYQFQCEPTSLFSNPYLLPTKKYINYSELDEVLNLTPYADEIYQINSLSELPESSLEEPKVVMVNEEINERLTQDFYGVIITEYPFYFTQHKIYGLFVSPYQEDSKYRNISYNPYVIINLNQHFMKWNFIPYTRNLLNNAIN